MMKWLRYEKQSEDERYVFYRYTDLERQGATEGSFRIDTQEMFSVSTVELPSYTKERIDEMKLAGKVIIEHMETGVWPASAELR